MQPQQAQSLFRHFYRSKPWLCNFRRSPPRHALRLHCMWQNRSQHRYMINCTEGTANRRVAMASTPIMSSLGPLRTIVACTSTRTRPTERRATSHCTGKSGFDITTRLTLHVHHHHHSLLTCLTAVTVQPTRQLQQLLLLPPIQAHKSKPSGQLRRFKVRRSRTSISATTTLLATATGATHLCQCLSWPVSHYRQRRPRIGLTHPLKKSLF